MTIKYSQTPPPAGTIVVNSTNRITGQPIPSSWTFALYPSTDPCTPSSLCTTQTNATFSNQPVGLTPYQFYPTPGSAGPQYSLRSVESRLASNEAKPGFFSLAFWRNLFIKLAHAVVAGPCLAPATSCPLVLTTGATIIFNPQWDPIADMAVSGSPLPITDTVPGTLTLSNTGAPGSVLNWSVGSITYSSGSGWLSLSPPSPLAAPPAVPSSQPVTVTYTGTLAPGPYTATIVFTGTSSPTGVAVAPRSATINLTVAFPTLVCAPVSQTVNIAQLATINVTGGTGSYNWASVPAGIPASGGPLPSPGSFTVNYGTVTPPPKVITVTDAVSAATASCTVDVIDMRCTLTANPTKIFFPGQSTLSWTCLNTTPLTTCSIDQGVGVVNRITGTTPVAPTSTTVYTLSCNGPPVASAAVNVSVQVITPGRIEVNPR